MLTDWLILAAPVVLVALVGVGVARWDTKRWEARCRAEAAPVAVRLFPGRTVRLTPSMDATAGRPARRGRHAAGGNR